MERMVFLQESKGSTPVGVKVVPCYDHRQADRWLTNPVAGQGTLFASPRISVLVGRQVILHFHHRNKLRLLNQAMPADHICGTVPNSPAPSGGMQNA